MTAPAPRYSPDVLRYAASTAQKALLCLAFAFDDAGRADIKTAVLNVRKQLIDVTRF